MEKGVWVVKSVFSLYKNIEGLFLECKQLIIWLLWGSKLEDKIMDETGILGVPNYK